MRKKALALIMSGLLFSTIGAFAQTENQGNKVVSEQTSACCKDKKEKKKHCKGDKKRSSNLFNGIELTEQQQQQIAALKAERKAKKEADKKENKEARAKERAAFDEKMAQILTPEQYAQYKSNVELMKDKNSKMKKKVQKMHSGKEKKAKVADRNKNVS